MFAFVLAAAMAASDIPAALVQRIVSGGYGSARIYVAQKPPDLPAVPLPAATLLGGVEREPTPQQSRERHGTPLSLVSDALSSTTLYYDAADRTATVDAYTAALTKAGWKRPAVPIARGGFSALGGLPQTWCAPDAHHAVTLAQPSADTRAIDVTVQHGSNGPVALCNLGSFTQTMASQLGGDDVLPAFTAPPDVTVQREVPFASPSATTRARLTSNLALPAIFDGFARQLTAAGWSAGPVAATASARVQTFTKVVGDRPLTAALTIYAVGPQSFIGLVDASDTAGRRSSVPGIRKPL